MPLIKIDAQSEAYARSGGAANIPELTMAEKKQAIFDLRLQGHALKDIAAAVGLTETRISGMLKEVLADLTAHTRATAEELRAMETARLDKLLISYWAMRAVPKFGELILKVLERRHKIAGLDVVRVENTGGPIMVAPALDLKLLSDVELEQLERIVSKAGHQALATMPLSGVEFTLGVGDVSATG